MFATLPFALVGGVMTAAISGLISLGTLTGLVAVVGIAARNGILLVSHFRHLALEKGMPFGVEARVSNASHHVATHRFTFRFNYNLGACHEPSS